MNIVEGSRFDVRQVLSILIVDSDTGDGIGDQAPHPARLDQLPQSLELTMESLAQELLEAIIDHVPPTSACCHSLVARRWRRRSQQRYFSDLLFTGELEVVRW